MEFESDKEEALDWVLDKLAAAKKPTAKPPLAQAIAKTDLTKTKATELELWKTWKNNGMKKKDLDPLVKSLTPLLNKRINLFRRAEVPLASIEYEHKKELLQALKTYDPSKAALNTHITYRLRRAGRFVENNKNFARITENIGQHIGEFNALKSELSEQLGYQPTEEEIHDHILVTGHPRLGKLSLKNIRRINREQRKGLIATGHEQDELFLPNRNAREEEVLSLIHHELTEEEKKVFNYTFGKNGKPKLQPGEMAKKLKMDNSKVSKLRSSINKKIQSYLE